MPSSARSARVWSARERGTSAATHSTSLAQLASALVSMTERSSNGAAASGTSTSSKLWLVGADAMVSWTEIGAPTSDVSPVVPARATLRWAPSREATRSASESVLARPKERTSELQSLMRSSYPVFCLKNNQEDRKEPNRNH